MARTIPHVITQHAEEAAFLWLLRDAAVSEPHYNLADLSALDNRVDAHLDGLRIAGDAGWEICKQELGWEEPGEMFAAAWLAFAQNDVAHIREVLDKVSSVPICARGMVSALGWLPYEDADSRITQLCAASDPMMQRVGVAASALHRRDPGTVLDEAITSEDADLRARALRAAGELGRIDLLPALRGGLSSDDLPSRMWSAWSALLLGDVGAVDTLRDIGSLNSPYAASAMAMALRGMDMSVATAWRGELAREASTLRQAIVAAGVVGDPAAVPWLVEQMNVPEHARVAGESLSMITGADIAYQDLEGEEPDGFEAGPSEDAEDDNVEMDADEELPWPDSKLIATWWNSRRSDFASGTRHLAGKPISEPTLRDTLREGRQRHRMAAALELALLTPEAPLFETRAPGFVQQRLLSRS